MLNGGRADRVPCDYWATAEVTRRLLGELGCASERELWEALDIDKCVFLAPKHPRAKEDTWHITSLFSVWNIEIFRQARGYIVCPCHNLQANTPTENIIALYDAVKEFGS